MVRNIDGGRELWMKKEIKDPKKMLLQLLL